MSATTEKSGSRQPGHPIQIIVPESVYRRLRRRACLLGTSPTRLATNAVSQLARSELEPAIATIPPTGERVTLAGPRHGRVERCPAS